MGILPSLLPVACCLLESGPPTVVDILHVPVRKRCVGHATEGDVLLRELNVLALLKGTEHYVFVYDDSSRPLLIDTFRDQAADPQLSLNWFDAAVLTDRAREQAQQSRQTLPPSRAEI